jgi:hypothetical protein
MAKSHVSVVCHGLYTRFVREQNQSLLLYTSLRQLVVPLNNSGYKAAAVWSKQSN